MNKRPPIPLFPAVVPVALLVPAGMLGLWWVSAVAGWISPFLLPTPTAVIDAAVRLLQSGELLRHVLASLGRIFGGFFLTVLLALPLAVWLGLAPTARRLGEPVLEFLRQIPPLALLPLLILWFGIGEAPKLVVIILATFFPVFLSAAAGIIQCDRRLIEVGQVCHFSDGAIIRRIVLPAALPSIATGLRLGFGYAWRALIGAELIAASAGLGYMITDAESLARPDIILVGILLIGMLGMVFDVAFRFALRRLAPWMKQEAQLARA